MMKDWEMEKESKTRIDGERLGMMKAWHRHSDEVMGLVVGGSRKLK